MATSALARGATALLEGMGRRRWGYPPRMMAPVVDELGPIGALRWFAWHLPRYQRTIRAFGEVRTYLLCLAISLINDCLYCTYAYGYALQLAYLREHGRLFPLDEHQLNGLRGLPPGTIRRRLIIAAQHAELYEDVRVLDRTITLALTTDPKATDDEDVRIAHLVRMFRVLNSIASASGIKPDEAPTSLNKDEILKRRYARMRSATG